MRVMTILGTRPEIIRLSRIIPKLDDLCDHILVHTGQNFTNTLSDVFFEELGIRKPDEYLACRGDSTMAQVGEILGKTEAAMVRHRPDRILILGDTNSALSAMVAKRMQIKVLHMEAGNRCFDDRVPEEVNRRVVDHSSDILLPYTQRSRENLLREGIEGRRIFVTGNPIYEVIQHYQAGWQNSEALARLDLEDKGYFLVTLHRSENVDIPERLRTFLTALSRLADKYGKPVLCSTHPRTRSQLEKHNLIVDEKTVRLMEPLGFFDFISLEQRALCVLSDSGTVQEECAIFHVPNVTLRDVTERPETIDVGSNFIAGCTEEEILTGVRLVLDHGNPWEPPEEYVQGNVSGVVARITLGHWEW